MARRAASLRDVAERAGASPQTVSRVANGGANVTAALRDRVLDAMRELDYRPNAAARAIRRGAFRSVGIVYNTLGSVGIHRTLGEISERAATRGYATTLMPMTASTTSDASGAFSRLNEMTVDVVIAIIADRFEADGVVRLPEGIPAVVVGPEILHGAATIDFDQRGGAEQAVAHLLSLGHRTVHHLAGPAESFPAERRRMSWADTLTGSGRELTVIERGDWTARSGYAAAQRLLTHTAPTAVFVANDQMALGAYRALHEAGLRVPTDVSVVGFDDTEEGAMLVPPLTTVRQEWRALGRDALDLALAMSDGAGPSSVILPTSLIIRSSTAAPRDAT
ncbi:LacI family DNA-binding transcriptional regulator [Microbacterium radiodurans]|nr:substrate-binding domain-containing protein [Microbacterium radiodurans]